MMTVTSTAGLLIGFKAIAAELGISEASIRSLHAEGQLPFKTWAESPSRPRRVVARLRDIKAHRAPAAPAGEPSQADPDPAPPQTPPSPPSDPEAEIL